MVKKPWHDLSQIQSNLEILELGILACDDSRCATYHCPFPHSIEVDIVCKVAIPTRWHFPGSKAVLTNEKASHNLTAKLTTRNGLDEGHVET